MNLLMKLIAGIAIGLANVIPGVSGGTIAVIFNAYEDLLTLTSLQIKKIFADIKIYLMLLAGLVIGILLFAKIITVAYNKFPIYTNFFFVGIIIGSFPFLFSKMRTADGESGTRPIVIRIIWMLIGLAIMIGLFVAKLHYGNIENGIIELNAGNAVVLFLVGIVAAVAMLIPGISGSFVLLMLGYYKTIISAVSEFNIPILVIAGLGVVVGCVFGSRLLVQIIKKHAGVMYALIFGLVIGSLLQVIPFKMQTPTGFCISAFCAIAGAAVIVLCSKLNRGDKC